MYFVSNDKYLIDMLHSHMVGSKVYKNKENYAVEITDKRYLENGQIEKCVIELSKEWSVIND